MSQKSLQVSWFLWLVSLYDLFQLKGMVVFVFHEGHVFKGPVMLVLGKPYEQRDGGKLSRSGEVHHSLGIDLQICLQVSGTKEEMQKGLLRIEKLVIDMMGIYSPHTKEKLHLFLLTVRDDFYQKLSETANSAEKIPFLSGSSETPPPLFPAGSLVTSGSPNTFPLPH